ncbi:MAG TPA: hypothetical protein VGI45_15785 [Terracidiphilus sp.]|jgi:hypothetical protein
MHFDFHFNAVSILWTLTFAALLVILVVLLGRDRAKRFPWFTTSIVVIALRLLINRLLHDRLPPITMGAIGITVADLSALVGLLVLVEMARRAFRKASWKAWTGWGLVLLAIGGVVLWKWGPWPQWKALTFDTTIAKLQFMQLLAVKTGLLMHVLSILLGILVVAFGARYGAGWRTHVQRIMIGLSTASLSQLSVQAVFEIIVRHTTIDSRVKYEHLMNLQEKLLNGNSVVYLLVLIWLIVCLWIEEPGAQITVPAVEAGEPQPAAYSQETGDA